MKQQFLTPSAKLSPPFISGPHGKHVLIYEVGVAKEYYSLQLSQPKYELQ